MAQLGQRTLADTPQEHVNDHNQLHSKANYVFDVKDFDAVGDGVTDDTAAIQTALTAGTGGTVYVPPGSTFVADILTIPDGTTIQIDGKLLKKPGTAGPILTAVEPSNNIRIVGGGTVDGNKANQSSYVDGVGLIDITTATDLLIEGILVTGYYLPFGTPSSVQLGTLYLHECIRVTVRNVTLTDYAREGIFLDFCEDCTVDGCTVIGGIDSWSGFGSWGGTRNKWDTCLADKSNGSGFTINSTYSLLVDCVSLDWNEWSGFTFGHTGYPADFSTAVGCLALINQGFTPTTPDAHNGISVQGASSDVQLVGCVAENASQSGFVIADSATSAVLSGCRANNNGTYGLRMFSTVGLDVIGSALDLSGNTAGATNVGGGSVTYNITNVKTSPTDTIRNFSDQTITVTGARDDGDGALASLLTQFDAVGWITDDSTSI